MLAVTPFNPPDEKSGGKHCFIFATFILNVCQLVHRHIGNKTIPKQNPPTVTSVAVISYIWKHMFSEEFILGNTTVGSLATGKSQDQ